MHQVRVGKYRRLQRAATPAGHFTILALDHQDALRRALKPAAPETVTADNLAAFKAQVIGFLAPETSAVLLDPIYGAAQSVAGNLLLHTGLLVELEKADYALKPMPLEVELLSDWNAASVGRMGADGAKLFFYYNPADASELIQRQDKLVRRVIADCKASDMPLYAEPILYRLANDSDEQYQEQYSGRVIEAAHKINAFGADVLKMEFPLHGSRLDDTAAAKRACEELTAATSVPWVLLSAGVDFETFCSQVDIACRAGASGFIAGRAVWGELTLLKHPSERADWLRTTGVQRMRHLAKLVRSGKPWAERITCEPVTPDWYRSYGEKPS